MGYIDNVLMTGGGGKQQELRNFQAANLAHISYSHWASSFSWHARDGADSQV